MILHHFKYTIIGFCILLGGAFAFMEFSSYRFYESKQNLAGNSLERYRLENQIGLYQKIAQQYSVESKLIPEPRSPDRRILWINALQQAKQALRIPFMQYRISTLNTLPIEELSSNRFNIQSGSIDLSLHLGTLEQLFNLFELLEQQIRTFSVNNCQIENINVEKGIIKRSNRYIQASCKLSVYYTEHKELGWNPNGAR